MGGGHAKGDEQLLTNVDLTDFKYISYKNTQILCNGLILVVALHWLRAYKYMYIERICLYCIFSVLFILCKCQCVYTHIHVCYMLLPGALAIS